MKYNRPQATASWGTMAKDWEKGIDYDRLHKERVERAQAAIARLGEADRFLGGRERSPQIAIAENSGGRPRRWRRGDVPIGRDHGQSEP